MKGLHFRRQRILRPLLVLIFQGEGDGDDFGAEFVLKTMILQKNIDFKKNVVFGKHDDDHY